MSCLTLLLSQYGSRLLMGSHHDGTTKWWSKKKQSVKLMILSYFTMVKYTVLQKSEKNPTILLSIEAHIPTSPLSILCWEWQIEREGPGQAKYSDSEALFRASKLILLGWSSALLQRADIESFQGFTKLLIKSWISDNWSKILPIWDSRSWICFGK